MLAFFDTNVLVYCTDIGSPGKLATARNLVAAATAAGDAVVSTQVLIELFHTLTRKQRLEPAVAQALTLAYGAWPVIDSDKALVSAAMDLSVQHQLTIWDAMVVEAAIRSGAQALYSEDLTHGQRFGSLTISNPFLAE